MPASRQYKDGQRYYTEAEKPLIDRLRLARLAKEKLRVKQLRLVLKEKGEGFLREYVLKSDLERVAIGIKNRLLGFPAKVAQTVAAMHDPIEIQTYLLVEIRRELNELGQDDVDEKS